VDDIYLQSSSIRWSLPCTRCAFHTSWFPWHSGVWQKLQTLLFRILRRRRRRRIDTTPQSCNIHLGTVWHWSKRPAGWFDNLIFGNKFSRNYNDFLVVRERGLLLRLRFRQNLPDLRDFILLSSILLLRYIAWTIINYAWYNNEFPQRWSTTLKF